MISGCHCSSRDWRYESVGGLGMGVVATLVLRLIGCRGSKGSEDDDKEEEWSQVMNKLL